MKLLKFSLGITLALFIVTGLYLTFRNHYQVELRPARLQQAAEADLSLIVVAQEKFHRMHGTYTTDLSSLGLNPKYAYYKMGFVQPASVTVEGLPTHKPEVMDLDALKRVRTDLKLTLSKETKLETIGLPQLASFCADCTATKDSFKAVAAANLDADEELDVWTVDQTGKFIHVTDDLKNK